MPAWADLLPVPPPNATRQALAVRLEETALLAGEKPVVLLNLVRQANDPGALGQLGQFSMFFIPQYQRLLLHKVLILRDQQTLDRTASAPVRFLQREAGLEQGIYSGVITASLLLPDVRVGDTLVLQYSVEGANPILGPRYVQGVPWQHPNPVQQRRVTLLAPEGRNIHWKFNGGGASDTPTPEVTVQGGLRRTRFEARDLPGVTVESGAPRGSAPRWLQFSEFADWAEVARWAEPLFPPDASLPPELTPLVQRWLRLPTRAEQASQALQWVQTQIRYYSVSLGESSHRPHSPAEVLANRYGDCKDKTFLLMRLLQAMGIPARAVLASLGAPRGPLDQLASPMAFDHAVVQAQIDGRDYFLDGTRLGQRGPLDRMGQGLEEASVLVVDGRATNALTVVRSPNRRELFHSELAETFKLNAFGQDGELDSVQQWNGNAAELLRLSLARLDKEHLQQTLTEGLAQRYPGSTLIGTPELAEQVDLNRFTLHARYKVPQLASAVDGAWVMHFQPANLKGAVLSPPSPTRVFPLALPSFPIDVVYSAEMQWPASVSALIDPTTVRTSNKAFTAEVTRGFRGSVSRVALHFEPLEPAVAPDDVPGMLDDVKKVDRAIGGTMIVAASQVKDGGFLGMGRKDLKASLLARAQASADRSGKAIDGGQLAGEDLAQALCVRAEARLQLGKFAEAMQDAQAAVKQAPDLGMAWFCQGDANAARGDFGAAEGDYGKALIYGQNAADVYFRRGQARFFADKFEAAADDFAKAAADRPEASDKIYPRLWQAATLQRLGKPLPADLVALADPSGPWPRPALAMFTGQITPEQVLANIERKSGDERELALVEGWFYIGEFELNAGQSEKARAAFEKARATEITAYVEYGAAGFELKRMSGR